MAATTCALCRKAVYAKTRHGSSLIKHFASEKTSSASSKRGRVAASSTQGRALKRSRSAENAGSAVLLPGAEQLHTQCHTPSHPKAQPSDPRTSTHFYDNNSDEIKAFLRRLETKLQSKLTAPLVASLRPRDRGESSQVSTKPLQLQIAKLRYDKLVHGGQWFGSSCGSNQWDPVLSNFVTRSFKPWFVKECRQRQGRCVRVPAGDADVSRAVLEPVLNGLGRAGLTTHARPPEVMFRQGKVDSCVFSGVQSRGRQGRLPCSWLLCSRIRMLPYTVLVVVLELDDCCNMLFKLL